MRNESTFNKATKGHEYERNGRDTGVVEGWNERNRSNINVSLTHSFNVSKSQPIYLVN